MILTRLTDVNQLHLNPKILLHFSDMLSGLPHVPVIFQLNVVRHTMRPECFFFFFFFFFFLGLRAYPMILAPLEK